MYLVYNCVVMKEFYLEILKNLLACYPDGRITSGLLYADHGGAANVVATLVQYAVPSARLSSKAMQVRRSSGHDFGRVWLYVIRHDNFSRFSSCTISYVPLFSLKLITKSPAIK